MSAKVAVSHFPAAGVGVGGGGGVGGDLGGVTTRLASLAVGAQRDERSSDGASNEIRGDSGGGGDEGRQVASEIMSEAERLLVGEVGRLCIANELENSGIFQGDVLKAIRVVRARLMTVLAGQISLTKLQQRVAAWKWDDKAALEMLNSDVPVECWTALSAARAFQKMVDANLVSGASLLDWNKGLPTYSDGKPSASFRTYTGLEAEYWRNLEIFDADGVWGKFWPAAKMWLQDEKHHNFSVGAGGRLFVTDDMTDQKTEVVLDTQDKQLAFLYALSFDCHAAWRTEVVNKRRFFLVHLFVMTGVVSRQTAEVWVRRGLAFGRPMYSTVCNVLSSF